MLKPKNAILKHWKCVRRIALMNFRVRKRYCMQTELRASCVRWVETLVVNVLDVSLLLFLHLERAYQATEIYCFIVECFPNAHPWDLTQYAGGIVSCSSSIWLSPNISSYTQEKSKIWRYAPLLKTCNLHFWSSRSLIGCCIWFLLSTFHYDCTQIYWNRNKIWPMILFFFIFVVSCKTILAAGFTNLSEDVSLRCRTFCKIHPATMDTAACGSGFLHWRRALPVWIPYLARYDLVL